MSEFEEAPRESNDSRLGQILLRREVITQADLEDALRVQEAEPDRPLGEILVAQMSATAAQVREALHEQLADARLGQILVRIGAVSKGALAAALALQAERGGLLGELLIEARACDDGQVAWALSQQNAEKRFGSFLLRRRLVTPEGLDDAMIALARQPEAQLSEVIVARGLLDQEQVEEALGFQQQEARLGQILLRLNLLSEAQLETALARQAATGQLLGEILISTGACSLEQIARALEEQLALEEHPAPHPRASTESGPLV